MSESFDQTLMTSLIFSNLRCIIDNWLFIPTILKREFNAFLYTLRKGGWRILYATSTDQDALDILEAE
jgi:hypothetical protein